MNLINSFRPTFEYIILPFVLIAVVGVMVVLKNFGIGENSPRYNLKIPREFFNNRELAIGDGFDKVSQMMELTQHWYYDGLSAEKKLTSGYYFNEIGNFYFDRLGRLESVYMSVSNTDSLLWDEFLKRNLKIMVSYYGKDCNIYREKNSESVLYIEWSLHDDIKVFMYTDLKNNSPRLLDKDTIFFGFNYDAMIKRGCFTRNETLESLGLF